MRDWTGTNTAAFNGDQRHAVEDVSQQLRELGNAIRRISSNQRPSQGGSTLIVETSSLANGDYGDIEVTNAGATLTVESAGDIIFVHTVAQLLAAIATLSSGGVIYVAPGIYTLSDTLVLPNADLTILGGGREKTIIRLLDVDTDIISIRQHRITLSSMLVHHGSSFGAGLGTAGHGRGIVIEAPTSVVSHVADVVLHNVSIFNTGSWAVYSTGRIAYDVLESPPAGAELPCYGFDSAVGSTHGPFLCTMGLGSRTIGSANLFADVRVGQTVTGAGIPTNTRVVEKASNSSITISKDATSSIPASLSFSHITGCGENVAMNLIGVICAFPLSGGVIYNGAGDTTSRLSALRTNSWSYGSYTTQVGAVSEALTMGQVHYYGCTGHVIDNLCIFQSPADDTVHDDRDATMVSFHQTNKINLYGPYIEILSDDLADGDGGLGGRDRWLFTSMNCEGIKVCDAVIVSKAPNTVGSDGYPLRVWRTSVDDHVGTELEWLGGEARQRREYYDGTINVASPPTEDGDFFTVDRDDFVFRAPFDGTNLRPITIRDFEVINYDGLGHRPPTVPATPDSGSSIINGTAFRLENNRLHRMGVFDDNDASGTTSSVDDIAARTALHHQLRAGLYGHVRGLGRARFSGTLTSTTNIQAFVAGAFANLAVGMRVEGNLVAADTYISAKPDNSNVTLSAAASGTGGPFTYTFYALGTYQREGLWGVSAIGNNWRQLPYMRKHTSLSAGSETYPGDLAMLFSGTPTLSVWPDAQFCWYHNAAWQAVFGLPRTTTAAGDLPYYSATDTPARLPIGTAGKWLLSTGSAPSWSDPDFLDSIFRVSDSGDTSKKLAIQADGISASTTRTIKVQDVNGSAVVVGNTTSASGTLGRIALTGQTGNISAQTLLTGNATSTGLYRVALYLKTTTAGDPGDTTAVTVSWNDGTAQTFVTANLDLATLNAYLQDAIVVSAAASTNITLTSTLNSPGAGTPAHSLEARIEALS